MRKILSISILAAALALGGCTRIETGEVGLRVNASLEVQGTELLPGSWNQTMVGSVLEFPVRDIAGTLEDKNPLTADDVAMKDVDMFYVYSIAPGCVSDIWAKQSRTFHHVDDRHNTYLMSFYVNQLMNNALYKSVRKYSTKDVSDKREDIEKGVATLVKDKLTLEKLDMCINVQTVTVRNMQIPDSIRDSAAAVVRSQNELRVKQNEVDIAKKEAERMQALSSNSGSSIAYMDAQARLNISEAAKAGKVNTIVVPYDFKGFVSVGK